MSEEARKSEVKDEKFTTAEFKGETYKVSKNYGEWPAAATLSLAKAEHVMIFLENLMNPDDFAALMRQRPTFDQADDIAAQFIKGLGLKDAGESKASSD